MTRCSTYCNPCKFIGVEAFRVSCSGINDKYLAAPPPPMTYEKTVAVWTVCKGLGRSGSGSNPTAETTIL